jgi:hypothetical protein
MVLENSVHYRTQDLEEHHYFDATDKAVYFTGRKAVERRICFYLFITEA